MELSKIVDLDEYVDFFYSADPGESQTWTLGVGMET